jgi:hypothetical protein
VLSKGLSVRATENRARVLLGASTRPASAQNSSKGLSKKAEAAIAQLKELSGKEVSADLRSDGSGILKFPFDSEKDLLKLKKALIGE